MLVPEMSTSGLTTNNPFMSSMTQSLLTSSSRPSTFTISPWRIEVSNHVPFKVHFLLPFPVPKEKNRQISTNNYMIALIWRVLKSEWLLPLPVPTEKIVKEYMYLRWMLWFYKLLIINNYLHYRFHFLFRFWWRPPWLNPAKSNWYFEAHLLRPQRLQLNVFHRLHSVNLLPHYQ